MEFKRSTPRPPAKKPPVAVSERPIESAEDPVEDTRSLSSKIRKKLMVGTAVLVIISGIIVSTSLIQSPTTNKASEPKVTAPEYVTVVPKGQTIESLGGWKRISPLNREPVFAYDDSIDGVGISVSQQLLPASFRGNVEASIAELAKGYNATDKINAKGTTVYIGTSAQGPQSVILTKDELLILIKSRKQIKDASWKRYIASLELEAPVKY